MEHFQLLDEDVANLILRHGILDIEDLQVMTGDEVEHAAALALQMADPEEQLAIAMRRSRIANENLPEGAAAGPARVIIEGPEDPNPGAYITWQERNRLLADSPAEPDNEEQSGGDCIVCSGGREPKLQLPCGCWFCAHCLRACIRAGLRPDGWPPKCCEPLENDAIGWVRRPALARLYRQVREENETPGAQRVYCARPACAAFIPLRGPHVRGDEMACPACGERTCRGCRAPVHPGRPCREEEEDEMLMDMMDRDGLASCPACRRVVELWDGCNHITCRCGSEWCYLCGSRWAGTCPRGCPIYAGRELRVPMRQRQERFRQGRQRQVEVAPQPRVRAMPPDMFAGPPPDPMQQLNHPGQNFVPPMAQNLQDFLIPRPEPIHIQPQPIMNDNPGQHPRAFDPHGLRPDLAAMDRVPLRELPDTDRDWVIPNPPPRVPNARDRYTIMLHYPDGQNTQLESPTWRRDSANNMQRIRDGVPNEGRVWPIYSIVREDRNCQHQVHAQWQFQQEGDPICFYCRMADGRQVWRCRNCGILACDRHMFMRFGLTRAQAERFVRSLRNRVEVESDFRYPRANVAGIERWDLWFRDERMAQRRRGRRRFWAALGMR